MQVRFAEEEEEEKNVCDRWVEWREGNEDDERRVESTAHEKRCLMLRCGSHIHERPRDVCFRASGEGNRRENCVLNACD